MFHLSEVRGTLLLCGSILVNLFVPFWLPMFMDVDRVSSKGGAVINRCSYQVGTSGGSHEGAVEKTNKAFLVQLRLSL